MNDFAGSADQIAKQLVAGGMEPDRAMMMALRMAQSRQQADESILGGVPAQPPTSDVPPATEILGGDPSRLFQRQPTTMERIRDLPKDVLGAGEALVSMGSLAALAPASMLYALRPGQKTQGDPMEFALRNMYMPRSERGPSHLAGLGEVLESLPQTGPLPELQAFTGLGRGVGRQLAEKGRQAGRAMAPAAANVAEDILRRQGLLMDVVKPKGGNWIAGDPNQTQNFLLGGVEAQLARLKSPTTAGETPAQRVPRHEELLRDPSLSEESRQTVQRLLNREKQNAAVDNWIDRNLTNYIKKEMATPEDPVRKLAEQGITHLPNDNLGGLIIEVGDLSGVKQIRKKEGFPEAGLAQTERGKEWELIADQAIESVSGRQGKGLIDTRLVTAGDIQKALKEMPELQQAEREFLDIKNSIRPEARQKFIDQGLSENEAHLFSVKMPINELAISLGKKDALDAAEKNYLQLRRKVDAANYHMGVRNPWIEKLDPETKLYGANVADLGFDHIVDVLRQDLAEGRIRPEQLNKVSMEQAVRRTYEYDQEMAKKMQEAQIKATEGMPTFKEYPEQGFKWVELTSPSYKQETLPPGFKLEQWEYKGKPVWSVVDEAGVTHNEAANSADEALSRFAKSKTGSKALEDALKYEGETMGHCVGGYCPDVLEGRSRIFSLRDAKGEPHVTVEVQPVKMSQSEAASQARGEGLKGFEFAERVMNLMEGKDVPPNIVQIKGKQNRKPKDEYLPFVQDFVRSGNWSKVGDPQNAGLRRYTDVFNDAEQRKIEALNLPVPNHMWLTGEEIQTLHNAINPEGKRLKYNASGQIIGDSYKQGGSVNHKAVASARRALEKAMAKGGEVKMGTGGSMLGTVAGRAAAAGKAGAKAAKAAKSDDEKTLPMVLQRAPAKTKQELQAEAERVGRQIIGEHVTKPGDTANLADYSKKVSERLRAMQEGQDYVLKETRPTAPLANIDPATGSILIGLPGDISIADKELMKLGKLKVGSKQEGGPRYGAAYMDDPVEMAKFWASNYGPANIFQNKVTELGGMYPERDILGAYMSMGRTGMNFAQHFADANLKAIRSAIKAGDVSKDDIESFNKMIREGWSKINQKTGEREYFKYPEFAGVEKTGEAYAQMMRDPELRKWFNDRMKTSKETASRGLPSGLDIEYAISEPELRNLEHSLVGFSLGRMQPGKELVAPVEHATYSHGIPGQAVGRLPGHVPARIAFPDASKVIAETKRPQDFTGTIQKVFPHQIVDQQWQDEVGQYLDYLKRITGRKKGGLMKKSSKLPKVIKSGKVGGLSALRK